MVQCIVGMVGHPRAGKSTFAKRIAAVLGFNHINKDQIRAFLIESLSYYSTADYSHNNDLIDSANKIVRVTSDAMLRELVEAKQNIIIDGFSKAKKGRERYYQLLKELGFAGKMIIVYVKEERNVILERLAMRDEGNLTKWVETFDFWQAQLEIPQAEECDFLFEVTKENQDSIIEKLRKLVNYAI